MSNVNVGQLRTILQTLPAGQLVTIQAGTVLSLINQLKVSQGSEVVVSMSPTPTAAAPVDLSRF